MWQDYVKVCGNVLCNVIKPLCVFSMSCDHAYLCISHVLKAINLNIVRKFKAQLIFTLLCHSSHTRGSLFSHCCAQISLNCVSWRVTVALLGSVIYLGLWPRTDNSKHTRIVCLKMYSAIMKPWLTNTSTCLQMHLFRGTQGLPWGLREFAVSACCDCAVTKVLKVKLTIIFISLTSFFLNLYSRITICNAKEKNKVFYANINNDGPMMSKEIIIAIMTICTVFINFVAKVNFLLNKS